MRDNAEKTDDTQSVNWLEVAVYLVIGARKSPVVDFDNGQCVMDGYWLWNVS